MTEKKITNKFKSHLVDQIIESLNETTNTVYYAFAGNHIAYPDSTIPEISNSVRDLNIDIFRNMIFGKRLDVTNFKPMITRRDWTANTIYDMYDDQEEDLYNKEFFVAVDETAYIHVYKCLYNANGGYSTEQPTFGDVTDDSALYANNDDYYETADGYQWKYMFSVDSTTFDKFATQSYIPIVANSTVEGRAKVGCIDVIKIDSFGSNYNNYLTGTFTASDVKLSGNNILYKLASTANTQTGFYSNTIMYLTEGSGKGQYKRISNSYVYDDGVAVVIESSFATDPDATTQYQIGPEVKVTGDGLQTSNAVGLAVVNTSVTNSIHQVIMLATGNGYGYATAEILKGTDGSLVTDASIRPIMPPSRGHGSDPQNELGSTSAGIYFKFNATEGNTIPGVNEFRQLGILKDPKFSNVEINHIKLSDGLAGSDGSFQAGETFYQYRAVRLYDNVQVESGNTLVYSNTIDFSSISPYANSTYLYLRDYANNDHFISLITTAPNSDHLELASAPTWTSDNTEIYLSIITSEGTIANVFNTTKIYCNDVVPNLEEGKLIIGTTSFAVANVANIDINDQYSNNATFETFSQLTRFIGTVTGTFIQDEYAYQQVNSSITATGRVHSANATHLQLTNITGNFLTNTAIVGNTSAASMSINNKYKGDIDPSVSSILYVQNDVAVERSNTTSEEARIILEF